MITVQRSHQYPPTSAWKLARFPRQFPEPITGHQSSITENFYGLGSGVGRCLGVGRDLGVGVGLTVAVGVGVGVEVAIGVAVAVAVGVAVAIGVAVAVAVAVGVGVAVAVGVDVGVGLGVPVGVGVGVVPENASGFVYRSNACNVPFGFVPSQFALSAHTV